MDKDPGFKAFKEGNDAIEENKKGYLTEIIICGILAFFCLCLFAAMAQANLTDFITGLFS